MCEDGLYINPERGGAFKITGKNLRAKQVKKRIETCPEDTTEENATNATAEAVSGSSSAPTKKVSTGSVESASKSSGTPGKSNAAQGQRTAMSKGDSIWEILVPTVMPNGKPIRTKQHREWDSRVRRITGGLTVLPVAKGQWVSPDDELHAERMIPVRIACNQRKMNTISDMTAWFYRQEAVMFYRISDEVHIREYKVTGNG